jgi:diguanylate cyclase (GGDEF)-like protein
VSISRPGDDFRVGSAEIETDELTGTLTRLAFIAQLRARLRAAANVGTPFGICIVDLDHLKRINLSHGLTRGDAALRGVAGQLVRTSHTDFGESSLTVGRYDGGAFAAIVEVDSLAKLLRAAEAMRFAVAAAGTDDIRLSASVGVALARCGESADDVLLRAEQALFLAKQFGRDRLEISPSPTPPRGPGRVVPLRRRA